MNAARQAFPKLGIKFSKSFSFISIFFTNERFPIFYSRPAVSHHLQIMKDAGIVKVRKEGTKNYYYFDPEMEAFEQLVSTLQLAMKISKKLPDRSCE